MNEFNAISILLGVPARHVILVLIVRSTLILVDPAHVRLEFSVSHSIMSTCANVQMVSPERDAKSEDLVCASNLLIAS